MYVLHSVIVLTSLFNDISFHTLVLVVIEERGW